LLIPAKVYCSVDCLVRPLLLWLRTHFCAVRFVRVSAVMSL
jgi:hypothetical protein